MKEARLLEAGEVRQAERALAASLRDNPSDLSRRTFLFELLCFEGEYDRAEKQLALIEEASKEAQLGGILLRSALHAERTRHETFRTEDYPKSPARPSRSGTINGQPFNSISDIDPVLGSRLEVFAAGAYVWVPFEHVETIEISAPLRLRDTLWLPARIVTGEAFQQADLGEVLLPAIYPFSWKSEDEQIWVGRKTAWVADDGGNEYPVGQKMLRADEQDIPLLEIREIVFNPAEQSLHAASL